VVTLSLPIALRLTKTPFVFKTWAQTSRFLSDSFTAFDPGFGVSHSISQASPVLLYVLNSNGLPLQPARPIHQIPPPASWAQFDTPQQKVDTGARTFEAFAQQEQISQQLQYNAQKTAAPETEVPRVERLQPGGGQSLAESWRVLP